ELLQHTVASGVFNPNASDDFIAAKRKGKAQHLRHDLRCQPLALVARMDPITQVQTSGPRLHVIRLEFNPAYHAATRPGLRAKGKRFTAVPGLALTSKTLDQRLSAGWCLPAQPARKLGSERGRKQRVPVSLGHAAQFAARREQARGVAVR